MTETAGLYAAGFGFTRCATHNITHSDDLPCPACNTTVSGLPAAPVNELAQARARIADLEGRLQAAQAKIRAQQRALGDANKAILKLKGGRKV